MDDEPPWDPLTAAVWDKYVVAGIRAKLEVPEACDQADRILEERRKRFGGPPGPRREPEPREPRGFHPRLIG